MKPFDNFELFTCFAANNISKADAYSAAANSFKTKQHLQVQIYLFYFLVLKTYL